MKLFFTDSEFRINGLPRPGIPCQAAVEGTVVHSYERVTVNCAHEAGPRESSCVSVLATLTSYG